MDLPDAGARPRASEHADKARLDFVEGARLFVSTQLYPIAARESQAAMEAAFARPETAPTGILEIRQVLKNAPATITNHRMSRTVQEMTWRTTYDTLAKREKELLAELDRYDRMGPGSVEYDPNFRYPDYMATNEFHLEVGGYAGTPIAGYVYHLGGNIFHAGLNDNHLANKKLVDNMPLPADGRVSNVLELACAVGMSSDFLKRRFPDARVVATDISAPFVRYAHKRAVDQGLDIDFKQMAAEDLTFPDNSFDAVFVHILFHELPGAVARKAVAEVYRVLRPGGVFAISDIKDHTHSAPGVEQALAEYGHYWQVQNNGEIFHVQFFHRDMAGLLREAGFRNVESSHSANDGTWQPNLALPMRVGWK